MADQISKPPGAYTIGGNGPGGQKWGQGFSGDQILGLLTNGIKGAVNNSRQQHQDAVIDPALAMDARVQQLIDDVDLLNGVPAYGAAYQTWNIWTNLSRPLLPFNGQIGPTKRVDLITPGNKLDGGLVGYDPGLWEVSVIAYSETSVVPFTGSYSVEMEIKVWDTPTHENFKYPVEAHADDQSQSTMAFTYPFVIPEGTSRFDVKLYATSVGNRRFMGGVKYSGMWLRRISQDTGVRPPATVQDGNTQT
jgi:hypothetical protein